MTLRSESPEVAVVWRGDEAAERVGIASNERLRPVIEALEALGANVSFIVYRDEISRGVRARLLHVDAVLAWIDPIDHGRTRVVFDRILRDASDAGVWVSAHPDTIDLMGTKDVLHRTRSMSWGSDVHRYSTLDQLRTELPARLTEGARVVKRQRGNAGTGVWKVELIDGAIPPITEQTVVLVHEAEARDTDVSEIELGAFCEICASYFADNAVVIDQAFQPRVAEGLVRAYIVVDSVVGFSRQNAEPLITDPESASRVMGLPSPKTMYPADSRDLARLRSQLETEWVPTMLELLDLPRGRLPMLWDADFLLGPPAPDGADTYVLCEINCSCVTPFPPAAPARIARATLEMLAAHEP